MAGCFPLQPQDGSPAVSHVLRFEHALRRRGGDCSTRLRFRRHLFRSDTRFRFIRFSLDAVLSTASSRPLRFRRSSIATALGRTDGRFNRNGVTAWHQISLNLSKRNPKIKYEYLCLYQGGSLVFWRQIGDHISRRLRLLVRLPSLPALALCRTGA